MWRRQSEDTASDAAVPSTPATNAAPLAPTRVSGQITIRGEVTGKEDLYLDGEVQGAVKVEGARVTIGPNGRVRASIEAEEIVVLGRVEGDLKARARVELGAAGQVKGDVITARLKVEEGALLSGRVETQAAKAPAPARARVASSAGSAPGTRDAVH